MIEHQILRPDIKGNEWLSVRRINFFNLRLKGLNSSTSIICTLLRRLLNYTDTALRTNDVLRFHDVSASLITKITQNSLIYVETFTIIDKKEMCLDGNYRELKETKGCESIAYFNTKFFLVHWNLP